MAAIGTKQKPKNPYPGYPLTPHPNGQWCRKIHGKVHFFGVWDDHDAALELYHKQAADLHTGRQPTVSTDALTVKDLANHYLTHQATTPHFSPVGGTATETVGECGVGWGGGRLGTALVCDGRFGRGSRGHEGAFRA